MEKIRASLFNNNDLIGLSSLDGEDELMEMSTEEILTVSVVNQSLFDTQGSPGLEDYFNDKSIKGGLQILFFKRIDFFPQGSASQETTRNDCATACVSLRCGLAFKSFFLFLSSQASPCLSSSVFLFCVLWS